MTEQNSIKTARDLVKAFNASDWDGCKATLASDAVYDEIGTSRRLEGIKEIIPSLQGWKKAMPDVKGTISNAIAADDTVVLEVTWKGTHTGPLQAPGGTVQGTGKKQTTRSCWVLTFSRGKIKESRNYFDMLSFLQQLNVLPEPMAA